MLTIKIPLSAEGWDPEKEEFVDPEYQVLKLEHSLVSLSKWESKWCKSFFSKKEKTIEETMDYIRCMTLDEDVDPDVYDKLTQDNISRINAYIDSPMTATVFFDNKNNQNSREAVTSELIYYWMITQNIPFECQYWHLNRLMTLIRVCSIRNNPPGKRSKSDIMRRNAALNAERRARYNSKG